MATPLIKRFGHFRIVRRLRRGGMADVFEAINLRASRRVALRLVEHGQDADTAAALAAERLGARLQKLLADQEPGVVKIHDFGDLDGYFFVETEYVDGHDLADLIQRTPFGAADAASLASELCRILGRAHQFHSEDTGRKFEGIVHGDVKPANIRIDVKGNVRILDFGIAKALSLTRSLTRNDFGSKTYCSPERLEDNPALHADFDLWAVGVVLFEMLDGDPPFAADSDEALEPRIRSRRIRELRGSCPLPLEQIVRKALAPRRTARYESAAAFKADLDAFLAGHRTVASGEVDQTRRTGDAPRHRATLADDRTRRTVAPEEHGTPAVNADAAPESPVRPRTRRASMYAAAVLSALVVGAGGWEAIGWQRAIALKNALGQRSLGADAAWARYEGVKGWSPFGFSARMVFDPVRNVLIDDCRKTAADFREREVPSVKRPDWARCRRHMANIVAVSGDTESEAMREYATGHVLRIDREYQRAVAAYERAAALDRRWPDPFLGLARTYVYNLQDLDRGVAVLAEARARGYRSGRREQAQIADAYRIRAIKRQREVAGASPTQEREGLTQAVRDCEEAIRLYQPILTWADAGRNSRDCQIRAEQMTRRLKLLDQPAN